MDTIDYAKCYKVLSLPHDVSLQELDERYYEMVEYWALQVRDGVKEAKSELQKIDDAYGVLLKKHNKAQEDVRYPEEWAYTMQQIVNVQERIVRPSMSDDDLWVPPREEQSPSPEFGVDDMDIDEMDLDGMEDSTWVQQSILKNVGTAPGFKIREIEGDITDAPDRAVLVHAVNCQGVWGYGIAKELKKLYPAAYELYRAQCQRADRPYNLIGTCLLIPPQPQDRQQDRKLKFKGVGGVKISEIPILKPRRWIACIYTSIGYGKPNMKINNPGKDSAVNILKHTRTAIRSLRSNLEGFGPSNFNKMTRSETDDEKPGEIWSPKFNSGAFGVDWKETLKILEEEFFGFERPWIVVEKLSREDHDPDLSSQSETEERGIARVERAIRHRRSPSQTKFEDRAKEKNTEDRFNSLRNTLRELDFQ